MLEWLHLHPHWAVFFTFLISLAESLAIVGTIVPGSVTMTAIGILIGTGVIHGPMTFIGAIIGAIAGDGLSYWLGHHYRGAIRTWWPFSHYPQLLTHGEDFFTRHGGKSVFIGRFTGPLRSIIPLVAGMVSMPRGRFFIANSLSAIGWSFLYLFPGVLIGAAAADLQPKNAIKLVMTVLILLLLSWLFSALFKWVSWRLWQAIDARFARTWNYLIKHRPWHWLTALLQAPNHPYGHWQLILATGLLLSCLIFILLAINVANQGLFTQANQPLYYFLQSFRSAQLDKIAVVITLLGEKIVLFTVITFGAINLFRQGQWRLGAIWVGNFMISAGAIGAIKCLINAPRPLGNTVIRELAAFPSGHLALWVGAIGFAVFLSTQRVWGYKLFLLSCVTLGLTRLYLGAHWLTDVLGALLLGITCAQLAVQITYWRGLPVYSRTSFARSWGLGLLLAWAGVLLWQFNSAYHEYTPHFPTQKITFNHWWQGELVNLPDYRLSRFGNPYAVMNLQWADDLESIETKLQQQGWQTIKQATWLDLLTRIIEQDKNRQLPFFTQLYQFRRPDLLMTHPTHPGDPIMVLRLWRANIKFIDTPTPLWLGSIHYRIHWHIHWLGKHTPATLPNLNQVLQINTWRSKPTQNGSAEILLIQ